MLAHPLSEENTVTTYQTEHNQGDLILLLKPDLPFPPLASLSACDSLPKVSATAFTWQAFELRSRTLTTSSGLLINYTSKLPVLQLVTPCLNCCAGKQGSESKCKPLSR